ncbi:MAG: sigma-70 family RNA polymerase sigma factor [Planctomycetes bacterium]|nr:sigma-70 family RNA polymerase sigma factor [Planctomycetota bacterium]
MSADNRVEDLFARSRAGDTAARDELFAFVHSGLHAIARAEMAKQHGSHTLQATALVNEAYLKLGIHAAAGATDRAHFMRLAGRAMRQILVDHARRKSAQKRADPGLRVELDDLVGEYERRSGGLVELEEAIARLQAKDPELVQLIELRFFAGRSMDEVAEVLGISPRSAARRWEVARLFLKGELER